jgi:glycosyltransferase involved in cell wall biosynthesis
VKLAYLLNSYPMTSTTFIRREIHAIEAKGVAVKRFAVRHWSEKLVDPLDIAEQRQTEYLLTGNIGGLFAALLLEIVTNPLRLIGALPLWWRSYRAEGKGFVRHINYLLQAIHFRRRTADLGIDHVHAHFSTNAATVAMLAYKLGGASYSFTVHGPDELIDPPKNAMAAKVAQAKFVVAITNYCRGRILENSAPEHAGKVVIIPCGLELEKFALLPPDPAGQHRFVCVGRLCANKGQSLIPEAVAALKRDYPDLTVELIGGGEDQALIESEIVKHGVEGMIAMSGWQDGERVKQSLRAARALLLPSFAEGLPIVIMEALASGRPVVTTQIAGIPELVDEGCGWIYPAGSQPDLIAGLRGALAALDEEISAKAAEGRRRIEARHDLRHIADALIEAFRASR